MYFPIGWPKSLNLSLPGDENNDNINHICCDAVKILVAAVSNTFLGIWYANPLIPIVFYKRNLEAIPNVGYNKLIIWKPDSRQLAILTTDGLLLLYQINYDANGSNILQQIDPPTANLKRDSAELFIKENIPRLSLQEICCIRLDAVITTVSCISLNELLLATNRCQLVRLAWSDMETYHLKNSDNDTDASLHVAINLHNIPFYVNQNSHLKSLPSIGENSYISSLEYSPFIGGCAAVFNDCRAAFLIAMHLHFETQSMHGFWVQDVEDATICSVNHKFRLLAYGRLNSDVNIYAIEDTTGGLEFSHRLSLHSSVMPDTLGAVNELKWSPDGCVLAVTWKNGGLSLWSTFGALLLSTYNWDFGLKVDLMHKNPLKIERLEWSTEGYQLFMTCQNNNTINNDNDDDKTKSNVLQLCFVKSALTMNPCQTSQCHVLLQGDDTLYLNQGDNLEKIYFGSKFTFPNNKQQNTNDNETHTDNNNDDDNFEVKKSVDISNILSESKYWNIIQLPLTYAATNWPIRYSAIDASGLHLAVAGRTGLAHYSMLTKKWKLFGNESQEKDFVISGGLLWWKSFIVMGCYSLLDHTDEIRCYPQECKLDNHYGNKIQVRAPCISLNMFRDQLIALTADGIVSLFHLKKLSAYSLSVDCSYEVDVKSICIHPACIVSLTVTNLRNDLIVKSTSAITTNETAETIIVNVCGRILMIQRDARNNGVINSSLMASCLASCVECFWLSNTLEKSPMSDCLWLYSGAHGMRVWLPILPPANEQKRDVTHRLHTFMSKRIMLSFPLKLYPLVILFDNVIVLGVENETTLYTSETQTHFSLPYCLLERKSQVYLHRILRQLIKRNLGYSAWEIAKSCRSLPYFPHALELLLHEVLEEEATSKEPIPDALLPSILDFIREFPVYLQTIVQCARKTEIALWPYLFSMAGKPKDLFQQCLQHEELETAASYLIILQNLEPSVISKQYATLLLDIALQNRKWELAKDLIRFLKAIDPNEIDSPRSSMIVNAKIAPQTQTQTQVNQNPDVFNLILGPIGRERSYSTTVTTNLPKDKKDTKTLASGNANTSTITTNDMSITNASGNHQAIMRRKSERSNSTKERRETFSIDSILQRHAAELLKSHKLIDLGYMSAFLDFHLVTWLSQEVERSAKINDFVVALKTVHKELQLPPPCTKSIVINNDEQLLDTPIDYTQLQRQFQLDVRPHLQNASSQTSESGYFSMAQMETPTSMNGGLLTQHITSIKEHEEMPTQMTSSLLPITIATTSSSTSTINNDDYNNLRYRRHYSLNDDITTHMSWGLDLGHDNELITPSILPPKLIIKIGYLLQLFNEANCTDYALLLSILLQDAASIGRIINVVIRTESLAGCSRIHQALKHLTQWSFEHDCLYRRFMIILQPQIYMLDQFIVKAKNVGNKTQLMNRNNEIVEVDGESTIGDNNNHIDSITVQMKHTSLDENGRLSRQSSLESTNSYKIGQQNNNAGVGSGGGIGGISVGGVGNNNNLISNISERHNNNNINNLNNEQSKNNEMANSSCNLM